MEEVSEKLTDGGIHRENVGMDGLEPFDKSLGFRAREPKHGATVFRVAEEQPVDAHPFVVRDEVVSVAGLGHENVVGQYRVLLPLAFEHERTACAEAKLDASFVDVFRQGFPVRAVLRKTDGRYSFETVLFRFENPLFAGYVRLGRQYCVFCYEWHMADYSKTRSGDQGILQRTIIIGLYTSPVAKNRSHMVFYFVGGLFLLIRRENPNNVLQKE
jgi:hypothetical protein